MERLVELAIPVSCGAMTKVSGAIEMVECWSWWGDGEAVRLRWNRILSEISQKILVCQVPKLPQTRQHIFSNFLKQILGY